MQSQLPRGLGPHIALGFGSRDRRNETRVHHSPSRAEPSRGKVKAATPLLDRAVRPLGLRLRLRCASPSSRVLTSSTSTIAVMTIGLCASAVAHVIRVRSVVQFGLSEKESERPGQRRSSKMPSRFALSFLYMYCCLHGLCSTDTGAISHSARRGELKKSLSKVAARLFWPLSLLSFVVATRRDVDESRPEYE